jgi:ABC-type transport system involved in cytochrome c biogenesis permease subunit
MHSSLIRFRDFFVSLRLTAALLITTMVLVFAATLDQVNVGIWEVQEKYFRSFLVMWPVAGTGLSVPVFPGGYLIGSALLINLLFAHAYRFRLSWRKAGILLIHAGLILLLVGELLSGIFRRDSTMQLEEGQTKSYSESFRDYELALVDRSHAGYDEVVAVPASALERKAVIGHPKLPFVIRVRGYYSNALLQAAAPSGGGPQNPADRGFGRRLILQPLPPASRPGDDNSPAAYVQIDGPSGTLGTWLVSPLLAEPQALEFEGRTWELVLRPTRYYEPFSITLLNVTNDVYPGTGIPKNFSSRVRVRDADGKQDREVDIFMNNPLRYGGRTFYQYQMNAASHTSVLEVVQNPSWLLPYASCAMMAAGLVFQFGLSLLGFLRRRADGPTRVQTGSSTGSPWTRLLPSATLSLGGAYVALTLLPPASDQALDIVGFGGIPVLANGRIKPLDSVARTSLLTIQGRQRVGYPGDRTPLVESPSEWLADVLFEPSKADAFPTFRIDSPEVRMLLGISEADTRVTYASAAGRFLSVLGFLPANTSRFSYDQLKPRLDDLDRQARMADAVESQMRSPFQRQLLSTRDHIALYLELKASVQTSDVADFASELERFESELAPGTSAVRAAERGLPHDAAAVSEMKRMADRFGYMEQMGYLRSIPPDAGDRDQNHWRAAGTALMESFGSGKVNPVAMDYARLGRAWRARDSAAFNRTLGDLQRRISGGFPSETGKANLELRFNYAEPFYTSMVLYALAFLLAVTSWLRWPSELGRSAFWLVALAWIVATAGIVSRMWIEGRPPVTNLYSSALFVGWGAVALCLALERVYRNAVGSVAAGVVGFATLQIAHHLALGGDTLEMMRAVLDSNFWLATHVVVVTLGYASTFLAGFLALIYILRGLFTRSLDPATAGALARMVYGVVCFATLFSLVGTILGGIWADQSWGRFWGWDPKENGALLIVIWNAVILHARRGALIGERGLMVMAVFGNIVTSWSWFGVNMLGVGLHSYGFMEAAFYWLIGFVVSQLGVMALALLPTGRWRSFAPPRA